ncbi:hypothetical protein NX774_10870 [Massilia agilis]|uniref:Uncharacterized protein n=1 Tax=Massilia agilis TaxID=1811226 RepID=A0ABT2DAU8_9BURK|nr:hypothetical protein [Massilia agilis]MCS0808420.1 hypothetical protein [Massilia agilis]
MSTFLYENFLEDKQEYVALRSFWIRQLAAALPPGEVCQPYANDKYADGELFFDGNPIASVICWRALRAVRIVQESPAGLGEIYTSWASAITLQRPDQPVPIAVDEKVIALTLTERTLERALKEIRGWLLKDETAH